jgi:NADH-quinone oxidoreductase subunit M
MTALFFALIGMIYSRTHTRMINDMGGLMKVIPFLGVVYLIAGLASLGLPGLSGFVAEMTIFVGAFQHGDMFHRVATIMAVSAIVVTAVYILRVVGILLLGPIKNEHFLALKDATWYERLSTLTLLVAVAGIGIFPMWLYNLILDSVGPVAERLASAF